MQAIDAPSEQLLALELLGTLPMADWEAIRTAAALSIAREREGERACVTDVEDALRLVPGARPEVVHAYFGRLPHAFRPRAWADVIEATHEAVFPKQCEMGIDCFLALTGSRVRCLVFPLQKIH